MKKLVAVLLISSLLVPSLTSAAFASASTTKYYTADGVKAQGYLYVDKYDRNSYGTATTRTYDARFPDNGKIVYWLYSKVSLTEWIITVVGIPGVRTSSAEKSAYNDSYVKASITTELLPIWMRVLGTDGVGTHKFKRTSSSSTYTFTTKVTD